MKIEALYEDRAHTCGCGKPAAPRAPVAEGQCRPYMKIEKDVGRFTACQRISERIGAINNPRKAFEILREAAGAEVAERFGVMTLDTHLHLRGLWETGAGETDSVQAPKLPTLNAAIADQAAAAVIYHVHPAASDYPSDADVEVTEMFASAFNEVGVLLLDHVIVAVGSRHGYYSFAQSKPDALEPAAGTGSAAAEAPRFPRKHEDALVTNPNMLPSKLATRYLKAFKRDGGEVLDSATTMPRGWTYGNVTTMRAGGRAIVFVVNVAAGTRDSAPEASGNAQIDGAVSSVQRDPDPLVVIDRMIQDVRQQIGTSP